MIFDFITAVAYAFGVILLLYILTWIARVLKNSLSGGVHRLHIRPNANGHHWIVTSAFNAGNYCNTCEVAVFEGVQCDYCGIVTHNLCARKADRTLGCKDLAANDALTGETLAELSEDQVNTSDPSDVDDVRRPSAKYGIASTSHEPTEQPPAQMLHHWVRGNLPCGSECCVCGELCGDGPGLVDLRCVWCQETVHAQKCHAMLSRVCSLGRARRFIVPPTCVRLKVLSGRLRRSSHVIDRIERPVNTYNWMPVLVVANPKSGNGEGDLVLQAFRRTLNPAQVLDLSRVPPETGLRWCSLLPPGVKVRIIVAGGDGTVQWVLGAIEKLQLDPSPEVGLIPLGTGNDLARVLGWGSGHAGAIQPYVVLEELTKAVPIRVDRWAVSIVERRRFGMPQRERELRMTNYLSIGVDACVTLNFHTRRNTLPRSLSSRFLNKMLFFHYGTRDVLERQCRDLTSCIQLHLDGKAIELPTLEGICIVNIPSWGAGVRPWDMITDKSGTAPQRTDDGLLEVFGLYSSFHIAQLQVGLSEPYMIGQARQVTLRIFQRHVPMQCDGEPWRQAPATITVKRCDCYSQATLLATAPAARDMQRQQNDNTHDFSVQFH